MENIEVAYEKLIAEFNDSPEWDEAFADWTKDEGYWYDEENDRWFHGQR